MHADYLERLSQPVQTLVMAVEQRAGIEFGIRLDRARAERGPDGTGILACEIDEFGATLLLPSPDYFPDGAVVHEVLHARRLLVEGVPKLQDSPAWERWTPQFASTLVHVDNALEHLLIVPEEIRMCPGRVQHWTRVMERVWGGEIQGLGNELDRRCWASLHWAFVQVVLDGTAVCDLAAAVLDGLGLRHAAAEFVARARQVLASKEHLSAELFRLLALPTAAAELEYLDSHAQVARSVSLEIAAGQ